MAIEADEVDSEVVVVEVVAKYDGRAIHTDAAHPWRLRVVSSDRMLATWSLTDVLDSTYGIPTLWQNYTSVH